MPNLWKYYFTLDKVFRYNKKVNSQAFRCRVGEVSCDVNNESNPKFYPDDPTQESFEIESKAGTWTSR